MLNSSQSQKTNWKAVICYSLLAAGFSSIFRIYTPVWLDDLKLPYGYGLNLLVGFGPLLGAEMSRLLFKQSKDRLPLYGNSLVKSIIFMLIPTAVLVIFGIKSKGQLNEHWFALQVSLLWLIYIFGEESGWRGYLQQILKVKDLWKAMIIGSVWYIWHFAFFFEKTNFIQELIFLIVLLIGSFIVIKVNKRTFSLMTSIGLHFSFSVMTNIPSSAFYKYGIIAMLIVWAIILWIWPKNAEFQENNKPEGSEY